MATDPPAAFDDPCPPWCDEDHDHDHDSGVDERCHRSTPAWFPAVVLRRRARGAAPPGRHAVAEDAWLLALRYADDDETWVAFATEHQQIELSPESAARLHRALGELLPRIT